MGKFSNNWKPRQRRCRGFFLLRAGRLFRIVPL